MSNRISKKICLVLAGIFIIAGCEQQQEEDVDVLTLAQEAEVIAIPSNEATEALEATGGMNAWKKTTELQLDCVVTFYQPDGSFYLTEQSFKVYPWSNSIQISADEPQAEFVWQFSNGQFDVLQGAGQIGALSKAVPSSCFAEAILNIITAPTQFLNGSVEFSKQPAPVKIQGKWYYPIVRQNKDTLTRLSGAVFYQDRSSSLVDMIRLACMGPSAVPGQSVQYVRGYDYKAAEKAAPSIPTRIEIFETDARDRTQRRLVKIDCHAVECIK
jgi:hypothetical protein